MTSPTSSLKKTKKVPLPAQGNKRLAAGRMGWWSRRVLISNSTPLTLTRACLLRSYQQHAVSLPQLRPRDRSFDLYLWRVKKAIPHWRRYAQVHTPRYQTTWQRRWDREDRIWITLLASGQQSPHITNKSSIVVNYLCKEKEYSLQSVRKKKRKKSTSGLFNGIIEYMYTGNKTYPQTLLKQLVVILLLNLWLWAA